MNDHRRLGLFVLLPVWGDEVQTADARHVLELEHEDHQGGDERSERQSTGPTNVP